MTHRTMSERSYRCNKLYQIYWLLCNVFFMVYIEFSEDEMLNLFLWFTLNFLEDEMVNLVFIILQVKMCSGCRSGTR